MDTQKISHRRLPLDAIQWKTKTVDQNVIVGDLDHGVEIVRWINSFYGPAKARMVQEWSGDFPYAHETIAIETSDGIQRAIPGDWIIQTHGGDFVVCRQDSFDNQYTLVQELNSNGSDSWLHNQSKDIENCIVELKSARLSLSAPVTTPDTSDPSQRPDAESIVSRRALLNASELLQTYSDLLKHFGR